MIFPFYNSMIFQLLKNGDATYHTLLLPTATWPISDHRSTISLTTDTLDALHFVIFTSVFCCAVLPNHVSRKLQSTTELPVVSTEIVSRIFVD